MRADVNIPVPRSAEVDKVIETVAAVSGRYLASLPNRVVRRADIAQPSAWNLPDLPAIGLGATGALDELAATAEATAIASSGPRCLHWATGGVTPAALGADMLASVYDQNARFFSSSPLGTYAEELAMHWLKDLCGLPSAWVGTLTTGATMANLVGLASARHWCAERHGWKIDEFGLAGTPGIPIFAGDRLHPTTRKALGMLGLGLVLRSVPIK